MNFNKVFLGGRITRDIALKYLPSNTAVAEFGLAVNRKYKTSGGEEREDVLFVDCSAFGKTGEIINQYFGKGKEIFVEGRLKYDSWEDKNGGGKRSKLSVIVDQFQFVGGRDDRQDGGDQDKAPPQRQQQRPAPTRTPAARPGPEAIPDSAGFTDSEIPF